MQRKENMIKKIFVSLIVFALLFQGTMYASPAYNNKDKFPVEDLSLITDNDGRFTPRDTQKSDYVMTGDSTSVPQGQKKLRDALISKGQIAYDKILYPYSGLGPYYYVEKRFRSYSNTCRICYYSTENIFSFQLYSNESLAQTLLFNFPYGEIENNLVRFQIDDQLFAMTKVFSSNNFSSNAGWMIGSIELYKFAYYKELAYSDVYALLMSLLDEGFGTWEALMIFAFGIDMADLSGGENNEASNTTPAKAVPPDPTTIETPAEAVFPDPTAPEGPLQTEQEDLGDPSKNEVQKSEKSAGILLNSAFQVSWKGSMVQVTWGAVKDAAEYEIYAAYCGKDKCRKIKTLSSATKYTSSRLDGKTLDPKKAVKVYVVARKGGRTLGRTVLGCSVGGKSSFTNAKRIKTSKSSYKLEKGKTEKIKARTVKENKKKDLPGFNHSPRYRYASSDKSVAAVDKNGKIKAVGTGICNIWVYAQNGRSKKVTVVVS